MKKPLTPVDRAKAAFGSFAAVGRVCVTPERPAGVSRSTVSHWRRPRGQHNGRGGAIPDRYHRPLLDAAEAAGLPLKAEDLIGG